MADETSFSAQSFAKRNFKKSAQKKRAVDSECRINIIKGKDITVESMHPYNVLLDNTTSQNQW